MNSKLYQKYLSLKIENSDILYLFKSKDYHFFIADDAVKISSLLDLSLTNLGSIITICEVPIEHLDTYLNKLHALNIKVKIIPLSGDVFNYNLEKCFNSIKYNEIISNFLNIKIDDLSISQSYDLLKSLQKKFKNFNIS